MSGIWDRIEPDADDKVAIHTFTAAVHLAAEGVFTDAHILAALNSSLGTPLDTAAETDLATMKTQAQTGNVATRARYLHLVESLGLAVEQGVLTNEAVYRSNLNL